MAGYKVQVLVCVNSKGAADKRHCGDKGGLAVLQAFKETSTRLGLGSEVLINKTGCTSQHGAVGADQTTIIIYGPNPELGGIWYRVAVADVEEIVREHIQNGRIVKRLVNPAVCVEFKS